MTPYEIEKEVESLERRARTKRNTAAMASDLEYRNTLEAEALELDDQVRILLTKLKGKRTGVTIYTKTGELKIQGNFSQRRVRTINGVQVRYKPGT